MANRIADFIGAVARPLSIIVTSCSAAYATAVVAHKVTDGTDGALFMGAVLGGLVGLYGFKAVEMWKSNDASK